MSNATYNGWTNRETWSANLWLSNDEHTYNKLNEAIRNNITEDSTEQEIVNLFKSFAQMSLAETARQEIGDFDEVNWLELGQMWIDEVEL